MEINCANVKDLLHSFTLVQGCDVLEDGTLRIATAFRYPNGSPIDIFIQAADRLPDEKRGLYHGHLLSDFGQTTTYLLDLHVKPWTTRRKRQIVEDICQAMGVASLRGELIIGIEPEHPEQFPEAMVKLAQACIRIADLSQMQRFPLIPTFKDNVEEFIDQTASDYEIDVLLQTDIGREVQVDFRVRGRRKVVFVKTASTNNPEFGHRQLVEIFSRWDDLSQYRKSAKFVTVVEDKPEMVYQTPDLKRLEDVSDAVIMFPSDESGLREVLSAA